MKIIFPFLILLLTLLIVSSCNNKSRIIDQEKSTKQINEFESNSLIQTIENNIIDSFSTILSTEKIDLKKLRNFSQEFLTRYIAFKKNKLGFAKEFNSEYPESYYFYQGKKYKSFYLLTFLHTDEVCCTTLYAATFSIKGDSLISMASLAYYGGDGGWFGEQHATWSNDFKIKTVEYSEYDDDLDEKTINSEIDTTWNEIELSGRGEFAIKEIKKSSYLGNKMKQ